MDVRSYRDDKAMTSRDVSVWEDRIHILWSITG